MLISIAGPQGSGKSTVLDKIKSLGHNVIERKTSRSILTDWDVTLDQVNTDEELTRKFQYEIIMRKYEDDLMGIESDDVWFTERTFADAFVFALINLGKLNNNNLWVNEYFFQCQKYQKIYDTVFYINGGKFDVVFDGVRGANKHYSTLVNLSMDHYIHKMTATDKLHVIDVTNVDERVSCILGLVHNQE